MGVRQISRVRRGGVNTGPADLRAPLGVHAG